MKLKHNEEVLLYVNDFDFARPDDKEKMHGHPLPGRVYKAQYNQMMNGLKLYIGAENNDKDLDGIFIHDIKGDNSYWSWDMEIINEDLLIELDIDDKDYDMISDWIKAGRKSKEFDTDVDLPMNREELDNMMKALEIEDHPSVSVEQSQNLAGALNNMLDSDLDFHDSLLEAITYLGTTFEDKYAKSTISTKSFLYSEAYGKGFNTGNALKYISRYCTEGFEKSNNTKDLLKAIHYLLFEYTRRKIHG